MNVKIRSRASLLAAMAFVLTAGRASAIQISVNAGDDQIDIRHDDVVVTADDDTKARITPEGTLVVDGRRIRLSEAQRQGFAHYNATLRLIKDQAVAAGASGAGLAAHAIGEVIAALAAGEPDRAEHHRVRARAEKIKDSVRAICEEMRNLQLLQNTLARSVPEFEPYAVIHMDEEDCHVDD
jgi:DUF2884 family protein